MPDDTAAPKWTPPPWRYSDGEGWIASTVIRDGGEPDLICTFDDADMPPSEVDANAHLIAAAPSLYEACAEFVRKVEAGEAKSVRSYAQMKAALALARGETNA